MAQVTQQCQDMTAEISVSSVFDEILNIKIQLPPVLVVFCVCVFSQVDILTAALFVIFTVLQLCSHSLAMSSPSVCLSVKRVNCDKVKETSAHILIRYERTMHLFF